MAKIFLSYHRHSRPIAQGVAEDLEAMGHTIWLDDELSGGQVWWNRILTMIRDCDVLVLVLDPESLESTACKREYSYAADLRKAIVPVLTADDVSVNLLPPALSQIQLVDFRSRDRAAVLRLARALTSLPPAMPPPEPLPAEPPVPLSYLGTLTEQIDKTAPLTYEEQSALIVDLRANARDSETRSDAVKLLRRLRKRRDLFASIGDEIDEVLRAEKPQEPPVRVPDPPVVAPPTRERQVVTPPAPPVVETAEPSEAKTLSDTRIAARLQVAGASAVVGAILVAIFVELAGSPSTRNEGPLLALVFGGIPWGIAGAIVAKRPLALKIALAFATAGMLLVGISASVAQWSEAPLYGIFFGGGGGILLGAVIGVIVCRRKSALAAVSARS